MSQPIAKPYHLPGVAFTGRASAAVAAGRFVKVTGKRQDGGYGATEYTVGQAAAAADAVIGVAYNTAAAGETVTINTQGVLEVEAGAAITAGAFVTSDANGRVAVGTQANAVGIAMDDAPAPANGVYAGMPVRMY